MCDDKQGSCGNHQGGCACGGHGMCGGWGRGSLLRVLLALLVLGFVFCAGVKVGMFKAYFGYGDWGVHRGYPVMMYGNAGYGMMQAWTKEVTSTKK